MKTLRYVCFLLSCFLWVSCLEPFFDAEMADMNYHKQKARLTMQLLLNKTNLTSDRADFAEIIFSSELNNAVTESDSIKVVDFTDNLAIKNGRDLLVREQRLYPGWSDTIPLKCWNYTQENYYLKFSTSNWPADEEMFLLDEVTGTITPISPSGITYFSFNVANKIDKTHRFKLVVKSIKYS